MATVRHLIGYFWPRANARWGRVGSLGTLARKDEFRGFLPVASRVTARIIDLDLTPEQALAGWPANRPLAALWSGDPVASRWCVLAAPTGVAPPSLAAERLARPLIPTAPNDYPPFVGGMIGWVSYDHGRALEPKAQSRAPLRARSDRPWPEAIWVECPDGLVFDRANSRWWSFGRGLTIPRETTPSSGFRVLRPASRTGRRAYITGVRRVLEYIRSGDVYQINLAHRLSARFEGSARALWRALLEPAAPRFGVYVEADVGARRFVLAGASPELFLDYDPASGRLTTRPMKGTRPAHPGSREDLSDSAKDRAELAMIVDLMRNDLGRVCDLGSVRVEEERAIEEHGDERSSRRLLQATALVSGQVRPGASVNDVLRATFPGGSVTGAPKIRAMQIIDELEPVRRGPYCGAAGFVSDTGHFAFNITIRSALLSGAPTPGGPDALRGTLDYSIGAGIVAESDPASEWRETLDKARVLRAALANANRGTGARSPARMS
ncbi:para-aminobenzoate synthetase component I [Phycisphaerales bacterium]|nr:para-aminobenzoate synthetase component I [Phycisphaerales bacterium]